MNLKISNISKEYKNGVKALDKVSLEIGNGMYGLLGPNGAGKSSLMRTIATLQNADSGSILFNDKNIAENKVEFRKQLGYLPQEFGVYPKVSAMNLLEHIATLKGINTSKNEIVKEMLHKVNLYDVRKKNVSEFSGGMRQRFGIAQALIGDPNLLIVDEPTAGLDPTERNRFHNILAQIAENKIVILSTHIVQDVIELCSKMAIVHKGALKYEGTPNDALALLDNKVFGKKTTYQELEGIKKEHVLLSEKLIAGKPYANIYAENTPIGYESKSPNLEDVFFYMTSN